MDRRHHGDVGARFLCTVRVRAAGLRHHGARGAGAPSARRRRSTASSLSCCRWQSWSGRPSVQLRRCSLLSGRSDASAPARIG